MRIAFVTADWGRDEAGHMIPGGSGWARVHLPARELERLGHHVVIGANVASRPDGPLVALGHAKQMLMVDPEIVVIQRWMNAEAADATRAARAAGQVVVHDVDDWFWGLDARNRAHAATSKQRDRLHNRELYAANIAAADAATVSSEFLARRVRERMGTRTILLRNTVDLPAFPTQPVYDGTDGLRVGWVGALGWRSGDLETMRGVLDPFLAACEGTFVHHGTFDFDTTTAAELAGVAEERAGTTKPSCPPEDYPELVADFDIGIVPLSRQPFNTAKSWIKGLEYAAAGIPFVAQRTAEYEALGCGLLASTPAEWREALDTLRHPYSREYVRTMGLEVAEQNATHTRGVEWEAAYLGLLERRAG